MIKTDEHLCTYNSIMGWMAQGAMTTLPSLKGWFDDLKKLENKCRHFLSIYCIPLKDDDM